MLVKRFGDDFIDTHFIEAAEAVEEAHGGLRELSAAGAEHHDLFPVVQADVAVAVLAAEAEEGVAFAFFRLKIGGMREQAQRGARCVVFGELSGRVGGAVIEHGALTELDAAKGLQILRRERTGTHDGDERLWLRGLDADDGGLQAVQAGAAIQDERDATGELAEHGGGAGGADGAETVRAGRGEWFVERGGDAAEDRIAADAHGDGGQTCGDEIGHAGLFRQQQSQRSGPEAISQLLDERCDGRRHFRDEIELLFVREVDDERVKGGALLRFEDFRDGGGVQRIGGESVNGLRGQGDDLAGAQERDGLLHSRVEHGRFIRGGDAGVEFRHVARLYCRQIAAWKLKTALSVEEEANLAVAELRSVLHGEESGRVEGGFPSGLAFRMEREVIRRRGGQLDGCGRFPGDDGLWRAGAGRPPGEKTDREGGQSASSEADTAERGVFLPPSAQTREPATVLRGLAGGAEHVLGEIRPHLHLAGLGQQVLDRVLR